MKKDLNTPVYNISVAARLCGIPEHTIRWLERNQLIAPGRTEGNQRLFSDADVDMLRRIKALLDEKVNAAGIRVVLRITRTRRISFHG